MSALLDRVPHQSSASVLHSPLDGLCVLAEAFLNFARVGADSGPDVVVVLLHHGLNILAVLLHLLPGIAHVFVEFVRHFFQVSAQTLPSLLSVRSQLGLQVVFVHGQLRHGVLDQGAVGEKTDDVFRDFFRSFCEVYKIQKGLLSAQTRASFRMKTEYKDKIFFVK